MKVSVFIAVFVCIISAPFPAAAQEEVHGKSFVSLGFALNADSMGVGVGAYGTRMVGQVGFYANGTFDFTPPVDNIETQDGRWFSWHIPVDTKYEHYILNGGLTLRPADELVLYSGLGLAAKQGVTHYTSTASNLNYWSYNSDYEYSLNFNAGAVLFFARNFGLDAGFNSASSGGYANIAIIF